MIRVALLFFSMIGTTLAGSAVVVALTLGFDTLGPILVAAALGGIAALPVTWLVARRLTVR